MTMPFDRMLAALKAIENLDAYLLGRIEKEGPPDLFSEVQSAVAQRREVRDRFVTLRLLLEGATMPGM